jgi:cytidylate kinase
MADPVVTISASYGAGGSVVAPRLAEHLGWPFIDRMITAQVSVQAGTQATPSREGISPNEVGPPGLLQSILSGAAGAGVMVGPVPLAETALELREHTDAALGSLLAGGGGVVLGRAAAVVLADRPQTLHIRLDGPTERRVARAAALEQIDLSAARARQVQTDRARNLFVRRLYRRDPEDPALYHLRLDTTVLALEEVVSLLADLSRYVFPESRDKMP